MKSSQHNHLVLLRLKFLETINLRADCDSRFIANSRKSIKMIFKMFFRTNSSWHHTIIVQRNGNNDFGKPSSSQFLLILSCDFISVIKENVAFCGLIMLFSLAMHPVSFLTSFGNHILL